MRIKSTKTKDLALIQKIPTPITPVRFDKESRHITLAYFEKKSTVDYIGAVQGIPVCFDAKECAADTFSLQNLHPHQVEFMKNFEKQNGISFLLIYYTHRQKCYYLRFSEMMKYWERMEQGGPKNFKYEELSPAFFGAGSRRDCITLPCGNAGRFKRKKYSVD